MRPETVAELVEHLLYSVRSWCNSQTPYEKASCSGACLSSFELLDSTGQLGKL